MFESATFSSSGALPNKAPQWMLLTLTLNLAVVATGIILPLLYPEVLPGRLLSRILYAPAPPAAPLTQPKATASATPQIPSIRNPYEAPRQISSTIFAGKVDPEAAPPSTYIGMNSPDSAIGSTNPGSTNPATSLFKAAPTPPVQLAHPQKVTVSGGVAQGLLLTKTVPTYLIIAKTARVSGTVVLAATIAKNGTIDNLRALSGPEMLRQAAIDAVQRWQYRPYLLNGQPVEVETTVNVVFTLGQ